MDFISFVQAFSFEFSLLFAILVSAFLVERALHRRKGKSINNQELVGMMNDESPLLIDVRSEKEFSGGHIRGSVRVDPKGLREQFAELDKGANRPLVFLCQYGVKAGQAVQGIFDNAPERVYRLRGGLVAWESDNLPLQRGSK